MKRVPKVSLATRAAAFLEEGIREGRWSGGLPGVVSMAKDLGVSRDTVREAFRLLEEGGVVKPGGWGRRREVAAGKGAVTKKLRVGFLPRSPMKMLPGHEKLGFLTLLADMHEMGHVGIIAPKSQTELGEKPERILRMVERCDADVWVVSSAVPGVLAGIQRQGLRLLAMGSNPDKVDASFVGNPTWKALEMVTGQLTALGHRRIVLACRPEWIRPKPGNSVKRFFSKLEEVGVSTGDYNAPVYEQTAEGFRDMLRKLFGMTPPTALILPTFNEAMSALGFLSRRGLRVPEDVSLVVRTYDTGLEWVTPRLTHFHHDQNRLFGRVLRWVEHCAQGVEDKKFTEFHSVLVDGESIGPPPVGSGVARRVGCRPSA